MNRGMLLACLLAIAGMNAFARAGGTPLGTGFVYQGKLTQGGTPYNGTADLQFDLWDGPGGGDTHLSGPLAANNVTVANGVFTVVLDFGGATFAGEQRWLAIGVHTPTNGGIGPFTTLTPRQNLTPAPYALFALSANGANINNLNATNLTSGTVPGARISGAYANAVNFSNAGNAFTGTFSGSGSALTGLNAGNITTGLLPIARGGTAAGTAAGALLNLNAQARVTGTAAPGFFITAINADGTVVTAADANSGGDITAVTAGAGLAGGGVSGAVSLNVAANGIVNTMLASDALSLNKVSGGNMSVVGSNIDVTNSLFAGGSDSVRLTSNQVSTYGSDGLEQIRLFGPLWGEILLHDSSATNDNTVVLSATSNSGGALTLRDATASFSTAVLQNESWGGRLYTRDEAGLNTSLLGSSAIAGGFLYLYQANGATLGMNIDGDAGTNAGALLNLYNGAGTITFQVDADISSEARISLFNDVGNNTVFIDTDSNNQGRVLLKDAAGTTKATMEIEGTGSSQGAQILLNSNVGTTIQLDSNWSGTGDGRIVTDELQITGGSDLSEQFDIGSDSAQFEPEPGMVVCIDPDKPGHLLVSTRAYDRLVAGIMSGAGGIKPGMLMGQKETEANGKQPVALTGRVYVRCTGANGSIQPGDLLTSSDVPGCAMKVTDFTRAHGAIIGKAMTRMDDKSGLVLVLVGLQ